MSLESPSENVPTLAAAPAEPAAPPLIDTIRSLESSHGVSLPHIIEAVQAAERKRTELTEHLADILLPTDTGMLVFGSLARDEWTTGSDVDWTLLLDGPADPEHLRVAQEIRSVLETAGVKAPGPTGIFGGMAFSHEIVHHIGGDDDTNRNMTRRILLLLESKSIGRTSDGRADDVRDRVLRGVIRRYTADDLSGVTAADRKAQVPRFLLNDVVRFWRTMAVDYASKRRERGDRGWALRNIKLRFSRKLIFVSGLLACFGAQDADLFRPLTSSAPGQSVVERVSHLRSLVELPPLQILAHVAVKRCDKNAAIRMFEAYDLFLGAVGDRASRRRLEELAPGDARTDELFGALRDASHRFQASLTALFFDSGDDLSQFSMDYGLF